jgi:hypothetical protein
MKMLKSAIFGVALAALASPVALAEMNQIGHYNYWDVYAGTDDKGGKMCSMQTGNDDSLLALKYSNSNDTIALQMFKTRWDFPSNKKILVKIKVDSARPWDMHMDSYKPGDSNSYLEFDFGWNSVNPDTGERYIVEFTNLLRNGNMVVISFPDGDEGNWNFALGGSDPAMSKFLSCMTVISGKATQPYSKPTQPYHQED